MRIVAIIAFACMVSAGQAASLSLSSKAGVSPIEKVIEMISELQQKIIGEGDAAQKTYDEFSEWCEEESRNLHNEIKTAKGEVEDLQAVLDKANSDIDVEDEKIGVHTGHIATDEADLKGATAIREKEQANFEALEMDLTEQIDTLERAVGILKKEMAKGASLAQIKSANSFIGSLQMLVSASSIDAADTKRLASLLQDQSQQASQDQDQDSEDMFGAPDPAAYESKSGGIVDLISELLEKAQAKLEEERKVESTDTNNFNLLKLELTDAIKFANQNLDKAKKAKAVASEVKAKAEGEMSVTMKGMNEDITVLAETHHDCMTKANDFELTTASRGEELKALATAKKVIIEATGGAFAQTAESFLQITSASGSHMASHSALANFQAVKFVRNLSRKLHSMGLAQLATRMEAAARFGAASGDDPFAKVKGLIQEMIEALLKEAEEEAAAKGFCDKEMGETKAKKAELEDEIEGLTTKIDEMTAESKKLKEEVATLAKELADLAETQAEMNKIREEENGEFKENKAEMDKGIEGIKLALKVLREYYDKPAAHGAADGAGGGIISMLEVVESDFTRGLEEMVAEEEAAQQEYDKVSQENEIAKTTKEADVKYKTKDAKGLDKATATTSEDKQGLTTELNAVLDYYEKLKPQCIAKPTPYEEIKKRREEEIAGLKEALGILSGEAVLLQRNSVHRRTGLRGGLKL